ncbi:MAG: methyltransferase [Pseudomonadota bacterium]
MQIVPLIQHIVRLCLTAVLLVGMTTTVSAGDDAKAALKSLAEGEHRSDKNKARNKFRHPVETLSWLGLKEDMTVVEIYPGAGGWYTEIIAPFLRDSGQYYAASFDSESKSDFLRKGAKKFMEKLAAKPNIYSKVKVTELAPPTKSEIAPPGSADMVLTFRNVHNWMAAGGAETIFKSMHAALKPGGILGVIEHRGNPEVEQDPKAKSGYVNQDYTIKLAESVGFKFVESSEINANSKDTKDYPKGVWTLPPSYRLGDQDRDKYAAVGESDRMTLKFMKPTE